MKTVFLYSICLLCSINSFALDLEYIRNNYGKAVSDKRLCENMINTFEEKAPTTVHLAYLGGLQTIWANHVSNPFSKLSTFKKGKATIEQAVKKDINSAEIRLIRLSVQKNCPAFLGYNKNINEDEQFLMKHRDEINSLPLIKLLESVLKK
jgi:hypothetical protein